MPITITILDIVRRERCTPPGMVELYATPMVRPQYDKRGVIVRITLDSVATLLEPVEGESDSQRAELARTIVVDRDLVLTARLLELT